MGKLILALLLWEEDFFVGVEDVGAHVRLAVNYAAGDRLTSVYQLGIVRPPLVRSLLY